MSLQADILVDRRRLKRRLAFWRLAAIALVLGLITVLVFQVDELAIAAGLRPHIARVNVTGIIQDDREQQELLRDLAKNDQVKAIILSINSPGGTTTGGESLYEAILEATEKKPVVAVFGTMATSAAYLIALASDHIVARANTITGSVGVIFQWAEVTELMKTIGVKVEEIKSGKLKATPSPFQPLDEAGKKLTEEMVQESQAWFLGLVAERRALTPETVPGLKDGRIFSGRRAAELKLIDQVGGEQTAIKWLEKERSIEPDLKIIDWEPAEDDGLGLSSSLARALARASGLAPQFVQTLLFGRGQNSVQLDGLVSLWHPSAE